MATSLTLIPTLRAAVRLAIGSALAIAMVLWCGRGHWLFMAVIAVVMFVSDSRSLPWAVLMQQFAAGLVGILSALVLFQVADGWLMLSVVLLVVALLVELLGLQSGRSLALLLAWGVLLMDTQRAFNIATVFDLALTFVIGLLSARLVTVLVWPQHPDQRSRVLDQAIRMRLLAQVEGVRCWLLQGGPPPPPLASSALLPAVLELQQLPRRQLGLLWRLIMRHWLLLEPQLLGLQAPLSPSAAEPLQRRLGQIAAALAPVPPPQSDAPPLDHGQAPWRADLPSQLVAMAIEQQLDTLDQLLHSLQLLRR